MKYCQWLITRWRLRSDDSWARPRELFDASGDAQTAEGLEHPADEMYIVGRKRADVRDLDADFEWYM